MALLQNHEGRTEDETLTEFRAVLLDIETRFPGYEGLLVTYDSAQSAPPPLATAHK